jgi:hypothetical protein
MQKQHNVLCETGILQACDANSLITLLTLFFEPEPGTS